MVAQPFWPLLYGEAQQASQPAPETLGLGAFLQQRLGFHPQHLALQGLALVLVRWPPVLLVPLITGEQARTGEPTPCRADA